MAGLTDYTFRKICTSMGCDFTVTEMVSAKGIYYNDKKTHVLLANSDEKNVYAQIFGHEPELLAEAAVIASENAIGVDINMGCPMPKITSNGDGSALLQNPNLVGEIVCAVKKAIKVPLSVKIRTGFEKNNAVEIAKIIEANGADLITLHARTREQFYNGQADWSVIKSVCENVKIPVIGNGDITCAFDAKRMLDETVCSGIAVGRAALGNPFIFREISHFFKTGEFLDSPTIKERIETAILHLEMIVKDKGEYIGIREIRKHLSSYIKGIKNCAKIRNEVFTADSFEKTKQILLDIIHNNNI